MYSHPSLPPADQFLIDQAMMGSQIKIYIYVLIKGGMHEI